MKELQTNGLTLEQELERYKSWLEDLHIRYDELKREHSATEKAYEELKRDVKRYWEVKTSFKDIKEYELLKEKLKKVGNE